MTIVTQGKLMLFGKVAGGEVHLNETGRMVEAGWQWLAERYEYVDLDAYVVMPNHVHGVLVLTEDRAGKPLGRLVGAFKTVTTKRFNKARRTPGRRLWQRNFYEHVIRGDEGLKHAREYIASNPMHWHRDAENPSYRRRRRR